MVVSAAGLNPWHFMKCHHHTTVAHTVWQKTENIKSWHSQNDQLLGLRLFMTATAMTTSIFMSWEYFLRGCARDSHQCLKSLELFRCCFSAHFFLIPPAFLNILPAPTLKQNPRINSSFVKLPVPTQVFFPLFNSMCQHFCCRHHQSVHSPVAVTHNPQPHVNRMG